MWNVQKTHSTTAQNYNVNLVLLTGFMIKEQNNVFALHKDSIGQENNASPASTLGILIAKLETVFYVQIIKFMMSVKINVKTVLYKCLSLMGKNV